MTLISLGTHLQFNLIPNLKYLVNKNKKYKNKEIIHRLMLIILTLITVR